MNTIQGEIFWGYSDWIWRNICAPYNCPSVNSDHQKNALIIIENPEAHLHPYSQSMLGKFLALIAENGVQIVIETHSEHIIDGCRIEMANTGHNEEMGIIFLVDRVEDMSMKILQ